jgi:hypothetical protein
VRDAAVHGADGVGRLAGGQAQDGQRGPMAEPLLGHAAPHATGELGIDERELRADARDVRLPCHRARVHECFHRHEATSTPAAHPLHG